MTAPERTTITSAMCEQAFSQTAEKNSSSSPYLLWHNFLPTKALYSYSNVPLSVASSPRSMPWPLSISIIPIVIIPHATLKRSSFQIIFQFEIHFKVHSSIKKILGNVYCINETCSIILADLKNYTSMPATLKLFKYRSFIRVGFQHLVVIIITYDNIKRVIIAAYSGYKM